MGLLAYIYFEHFSFEEINLYITVSHKKFLLITGFKLYTYGDDA